MEIQVKTMNESRKNDADKQKHCTMKLLNFLRHDLINFQTVEKPFTQKNSPHCQLAYEATSKLRL